MLVDRMSGHWQHFGPGEMRKRIRVESGQAVRTRLGPRDSAVDDCLAQGDAMNTRCVAPFDDAIDAPAMLYAVFDKIKRPYRCAIRAVATTECLASDPGGLMPPVHCGRAGGRRRHVHG